MALLLEFLDWVNFKRTLNNTLKIEDLRNFHLGSYADIFIQKVLLNLAGYLHDNAANSFRQDPAMRAILGENQLVSQASLSRFFCRFTPANLEQLRQLIWEVAAMAFKRTKQREFVLDIDSTHADTFGHQEKTAFKSHYMSTGYHPRCL